MYSDGQLGGEKHVSDNMNSLHEDSTKASEISSGVNPPAYVIPIVVVLLMLLYILYVYVRCYFVSERRPSRRESFFSEKDADYYRLNLPSSAEPEKVQVTQSDKQTVVVPSRSNQTRTRRQKIDTTQQETRRID